MEQERRTDVGIGLIRCQVHDDCVAKLFFSAGVTSICSGRLQHLTSYLVLIFSCFLDVKCFDINFVINFETDCSLIVFVHYSIHRWQ